MTLSMTLEVAFGLVALTWVLALAAGLSYVLLLFFGPVASAAAVALTAAYVALGYSTVFVAYRVLKKPTSLKVSEALLWSKVALISAVLALVGGNLLYAFSSALMTLSLYLYGKDVAKRSREVRL